MASKYVEEGQAVGLEFPYDKETRTWSVVKVDGEKRETLSEGHRSMGQAFRSATTQADEPAAEPEKPAKKAKRAKAAATA